MCLHYIWWLMCSYCYILYMCFHYSMCIPVYTTHIWFCSAKLELRLCFRYYLKSTDVPHHVCQIQKHIYIYNIFIWFIFFILGVCLNIYKQQSVYFSVCVCVPESLTPSIHLLLASWDRDKGHTHTTSPIKTVPQASRMDSWYGTVMAFHGLSIVTASQDGLSKV